MDDFVRNFLYKAGLSRTLETFEAEWCARPAGAQHIGLPRAPLLTTTAVLRESCHPAPCVPARPCRWHIQWGARGRGSGCPGPSDRSTFAPSTARTCCLPGTTSSRRGACRRPRRSACRTRMRTTRRSLAAWRRCRRGSRRPRRPRRARRRRGRRFARSATSTACTTSAWGRCGLACMLRHVLLSRPPHCGGVQPVPSSTRVRLVL